MTAIESRVSARDPTFAVNRDAMTALVEDLRSKVAVIE